MVEPVRLWKKEKTSAVSVETPQKGGGIRLWKKKEKPMYVSLAPDLKGIKIEDTEEIIPREKFTPEMKTTYRSLMNQLIEAQKEAQKKIPTTYGGIIKAGAKKAWSGIKEIPKVVMKYPEKFIGVPAIYRPSEYKQLAETAVKIPTKVGWGAILATPKLRDEYIEENPQFAIDYVDDFERIVGPFVRKMYPSRIPLAVAEKITGKKLATTYDELAHKYPVSTTISGMMGDIYNLVSLSVLTGGISNYVKAPAMAKTWYPFLGQFVPRAAHFGATWGLKGVIDESLSQFEKGAFEPTQILKEGAKETLFGVLIAGAWSIEATGLRKATVVGTRAGWVALEGYLKDGSIDRDDLLNIGANAILAYVFASINADGVTRRMKEKKFFDFNHQKNVATAMDALKISRKEAEHQVIFVESLAKDAIMGRTPLAIHRQVEGQIPDMIKGLSLPQQTKMADQIINITQPLIESGIPVWEAITQALTQVGFPRVEIPTVPVTEVAPGEVERAVIRLWKKPEVAPEVAPAVPEGVPEGVPVKSAPAKPEVEVKPEIITSSELVTIAREFEGIKKGELIEDPFRYLNMGGTEEEAIKIFDLTTLEDDNVRISRVAVKHIVEQRGDKEAQAILKVMPEIVTHPSDVINNFSREDNKIRDGYLFVKMNGAPKVVVVEVQRERNRLEVRTAGLKYTKDEFLNIKNRVLKAGGTAFYSQKNRISPIDFSREEERTRSGGRFSDLQLRKLGIPRKLTVEPKITKAKEDVKGIKPEVKPEITKVKKALTFPKEMPPFDAILNREIGSAYFKAVSKDMVYLRVDTRTGRPLTEKMVPAEFVKSIYVTREEYSHVKTPQDFLNIVKTKLGKPIKAEFVAEIDEEARRERIKLKILEAEGEIWQALAWAEARERYAIPSEEMGVDYQFLAKSTGFPDWVPAHLRKKPIVDAVAQHLIEGTEPSKSFANQKELYDLIKERVIEKAGLTEADLALVPEFMQPTETKIKVAIEELVKKYEPKIKPAGLAEKVGSIYERLAIARHRGVKVGRLVQEETILKLIAKGEEMAARKAFTEGKNTGIFTAKEHYNEVVARAKARKGIRAIINKIKKEIKEIDIKTFRPERQENIKKIMKGVDLLAMRPATKQKLESRLDYVREYPDNMIPQNKLDELARLDKTPLAEMTVEDMITIRDALRHEIKLNDLKNKMIFGKRYRDMKEVVQISIENVVKGSKIEREDPLIISSKEASKQAGYFGAVVRVDFKNPETILENLDWGRRGEQWNVLYNGFDQGRTDQLRNEQEAEDMIRERMEDSGIDWKSKEFKRWSGAFSQKKKDIDWQRIMLTKSRVIEITKGERISILLAARNKKNLAHLIEGGFRFSRKGAFKYTISEEDLTSIMESATPEERVVANIFSWFLNDVQKENINEISMDLNGFELALEPNYWPIRTVELDRTRDALKMKKSFTHATLEGMGIFMERTNAKNALVIEDAFSVLRGHIKKTSHYIGLAKPLRNAKMLLQDGDYRQAMMRSGPYGKHILNYFSNSNRTGLIDLLEDNSSNTNNMEKLLAGFFQKLDRAILGLNPFTMMKQPVSYLMASTEMDIKYLAKAAKLARIHPEEMWKWSPQLRDRLKGNITRELGELGQVGEVRRFFTGKKGMADIIFMKGLRKGDLWAIGRIWEAVKMEVKDTHPTAVGDEFMTIVASRAEEIMRKTQPTWFIKDRSGVARYRNWMWRIMTRYTTQRNKNYNMAIRAVQEYNRSGKGVNAKGTLTWKLFVVMLVNALLINLIDDLRRLIYGKKKIGIGERIVNVFGVTLGNVYFVGDLFSSLTSKIKYGTFGGWDQSNIVTSFIGQVIDMMANAGITIKQVVTEENYKTGVRAGERKWKVTIQKLFNDTISVGGKIKGIPVDTVKKLLMGLYDIASGKRFKKEEAPSSVPQIEIPMPRIPTPSAPKF